MAMSASGLAALFLADLKSASADEVKRAVDTPKQAPAKACVVLWMNGGPSHVDTFDPKPRGRGAGPFKPITTRASGVSFSDRLPQLADQAQHLAVVRGMTSKEGNHERARFLAHTGYSPTATAALPAFGAWISHKRGGEGDALPAFVSLGGPSEGGGFLGPANGPFVVLEPGAVPSNLQRPRRVDASREAARLDALRYVEARFAKKTGDAAVAAHAAVIEKAARLMHAPRVDAFDVASEPAATQKAYGDTRFGRGCLVARRLVEAGVRYVEVEIDGWDTHKDGWSRTKKLCGEFDPAAASLVKDLDARGLLASTLVVMMGEFGRSPAINANDGRDHHPAAFSAVLAGGGLRGGVAHGGTDGDGEAVTSQPTRVADLFATLATQLGLDPAAAEEARSGRPISLTDSGKAIRALIG
jgi:hypothetical protein